MALVPIETVSTYDIPKEPQDVFPDPPPIAITPCDPWPRPYFFKDGLRRVKPYHFTYNTYCKERWRGRELLDVFESEFRDRPREYYKDALERGRIVINGEMKATNFRIRNGDIVSHTQHRHEPPVTAKPIGIVHEDNDMIVISKPAGIPVHPAGRYGYNSITEIIRAERGYWFNPMPCNRLDRLTSGIMFVGKNAPAAERISKQIRERTVKKEYVARVVGCFPEGDVVCEQPILSISPKLGLNRVRANGKDARTVFRRLAYYAPLGEAERDTSIKNDSGMPWKSKRGYSIVRCLPLTGRTHQLRVHLQFLGHPITNDPIYCNQKVFGQDLGKGDGSGEKDEDIITRLSRMGKEEVADAVAYHDEMVDDFNKRKAEKMTGEFCDVCDTPLYSDPGVHELGIYLHARKYADTEGQWSYETPLPEWALPPAGVQGPSVATQESDPLQADLTKLGLDEESSALSQT